MLTDLMSLAATTLIACMCLYLLRPNERYEYDLLLARQQLKNSRGWPLVLVMMGAFVAFFNITARVLGYGLVVWCSLKIFHEVLFR